MTNSLTKTRFFPAELLKRDIDDYTTRSAAYNALLTSYNTLKDTYNAKLAENDKSYDEFTRIFNPPVPILVPERPSQPSSMQAYQGFSWGNNDPATTIDPTKVCITQAYGGWGGITMGLLTQAVGLGKSYGVYGSSSTATTNIAQSYVAAAADMTSSNTNTKYMIISLLAQSPNSVD